MHTTYAKYAKNSGHFENQNGRPRGDRKKWHQVDLDLLTCRQVILKVSKIVYKNAYGLHKLTDY